MDCDAPYDFAAALALLQRLRPALAELGIQASGKETSTILSRYDSNANMSLELTEFAQLVQDITAFNAQQQPPTSAPSRRRPCWRLTSSRSCTTVRCC